MSESPVHNDTLVQGKQEKNKMYPIIWTHDRCRIKLHNILYTAIDDYVLDVPQPTNMSKVYRLDLPDFTLIGTTTKTSAISMSMQKHFQITIELDSYSENDLARIVLDAANRLLIPIEKEAAVEFGKRAKGIPSIAVGFINRARDVMISMGKNAIDLEVAIATFDLLGIDCIGLQSGEKGC